MDSTSERGAPAGVLVGVDVGPDVRATDGTGGAAGPSPRDGLMLIRGGATVIRLIRPAGAAPGPPVGPAPGGAIRPTTGTGGPDCMDCPDCPDCADCAARPGMVGAGMVGIADDAAAGVLLGGAAGVHGPAVLADALVLEAAIGPAVVRVGPAGVRRSGSPPRSARASRPGTGTPPGAGGAVRANPVTGPPLAAAEPPPAGAGATRAQRSTVLGEVVGVATSRIAAGVG